MRITERYRNLPIKYKLRLIVVVPLCLALLPACVAVVIYDQLASRSEMRENLEALADIVVSNSTASLLFRDQKSAAEVLAGLKAKRNVSNALIYSADGRPFAYYGRDPNRAAAALFNRAYGSWFDDEMLVSYKEVDVRGQRVGAVCLVSDLGELRTRVKRFGWIVLGVVLGTGLVALALSLRLQRSISIPIEHLSAVAKSVSERGSFSVRAKKHADDELGKLVEAFNEMLSEIEQRDSELRSAMDAAEQANHSKSVFLANMSHELRTPLNAIIGYGELLQEEADESGARNMVPDLERICSAGKHLLAIINDILDISKIEAGRHELHYQPHNLVSMIQESVNVIKPLAAKNGNEVIVKCPPGLEPIVVDEAKLRQSLMNLLSNACKFTQNGKVTLEVCSGMEKGRQWFYLGVQDTGIGIAPEQLKKLFRPFSQVDSSSTRIFGGTGLGLAISQKFCHLMGGEITVLSELGKGSTFTIRIPARPLGHCHPPVVA